MGSPDHPSEKERWNTTVLHGLLVPKLQHSRGCLSNATDKRLFGSVRVSLLDLASSYWQVSIAGEDQQKTAFITPMGPYEFL